MSGKQSHSDFEDQQRKMRKRSAHNDDDQFRLLWHVFYELDESHASLAEKLRFSKTTVDRMFRELKAAGIVHGKSGGTCLDLTKMDGGKYSFPKAIIGADVQIEDIRNFSKGQSNVPYASEEEMVLWICNRLPQEKEYKERIIVEGIDILMGSANMALLIRVCGMCHRIVFNFARHAVEMMPGIRRTQTLMIDYCVQKRPLLRME